jgi:hypothetical protein
MFYGADYDVTYILKALIYIGLLLINLRVGAEKNNPTVPLRVVKGD